jgi:hypothetical protein
MHMSVAHIGAVLRQFEPTSLHLRYWNRPHRQKISRNLTGYLPRLFPAIAELGALANRAFARLEIAENHLPGMYPSLRL